VPFSSRQKIAAAHEMVADAAYKHISDWEVQARYCQEHPEFTEIDVTESLQNLANSLGYLEFVRGWEEPKKRKVRVTVKREKAKSRVR
jgi:hypothetical protein